MKEIHDLNRMFSLRFSESVLMMFFYLNRTAERSTMGKGNVRQRKKRSWGGWEPRRGLSCLSINQENWAEQGEVSQCPEKHGGGLGLPAGVWGKQGRAERGVGDRW